MIIRNVLAGNCGVYLTTMAVVACFSIPAGAQTVTVAKTGGTFDTVQAAIDSFATDADPAPNVIQITDGEVYDEIITVNRPMTVEGTGAERPRLALQSNAAGGSTDGLVVVLPTGTTTGTVALKNLVLIPSLSSTPGARGLRTASANMFLHLQNVLITANNGSNQPVSVDGLMLEDLTGATHFGDDGMFIGSAGGIEEAGLEALFRDLVVTHNKGPATPDGIITSNAGSGLFRRYQFEDGCVFSFNQRVGMQLNGDVIVNAPNRRLLVTGHSNTGFWFVTPGNSVRTINGLNSINNAGRGFWIQNGIGAGINFTMTNSIIANNGTNNAGIYNFDFTSSGGATPPAVFEDITIANQAAGAGAIIFSGGVECDVTVRNSILAGNGTPDGHNTLFYGGTGTLTLEGTALVTDGPYSLSSDSLTIGGGPVAGTPTTNADPQFAETADVNSESFYDVTSAAYATANATGGPLSGGADYAPTTAVKDWSVY